MKHLFFNAGMLIPQLFGLWKPWFSVLAVCGDSCSHGFRFMGGKYGRMQVRVTSSQTCLRNRDGTCDY